MDAEKFLASLLTFVICAILFPTWHNALITASVSDGSQALLDVSSYVILGVLALTVTYYGLKEDK